MEAAVIGVPHDEWDEVGLAFVVAAVDADVDSVTVVAALRERLAGFKVPRHVELVDELPNTATGKVRKPDLRSLSASTNQDTT